MKYLSGLSILIASFVQVANAEIIYDESRQRNIPVAVTYPVDKSACSIESKCPVAFLSAGYGISHLQYTFLANELNQLGYLTVAIGHELPSDPPLSVTGNLFDTRSENWRRGANTLDFLKIKLSKRLTSYDFENLLLVGHSNGGDISAWLGNENKDYIKNIITLDHRRVPLPRNPSMAILSIRASDYQADKGVLPSEREQLTQGSCIVKIPESRHNDIADFGPQWLKSTIVSLVRSHLNGQPCSALK